VNACEAATNVSTGSDGVTPARIHLLYFYCHLTAYLPLSNREQLMALLYKLNRVISRRSAIIEGSVSDSLCEGIVCFSPPSFHLYSTTTYRCLVVCSTREG
jgi:hypothetical protein